MNLLLVLVAKRQLQYLWIKRGGYWWRLLKNNFQFRNLFQIFVLLTMG